MVEFETHAARLAANLLAAQCVALGLTVLERCPNGEVRALLGGSEYRFRWDVAAQKVVLVQVQHPGRKLDVVLAA